MFFFFFFSRCVIPRSMAADVLNPGRFISTAAAALTVFTLSLCCRGDFSCYSERNNCQRGFWELLSLNFRLDFFLFYVFMLYSMCLGL